MTKQIALVAALAVTTISFSANAVIKKLSQEAETPISSAGETTNTTSATIRDVSDTGDKSPFTFQWKNWNEYGTGAIENGGEVSVWDRVYVTYQATPDVSLSVIPQFDRTWFGTKNKMLDTQLVLVDSKLAQINEDLIVSGYLRYDIPTGQDTRDQLGNGQSRVNVGITQTVGKGTVGVSTTARFYLNTRDKWNKPVAGGGTEESVLNSHRIDTVVNGTYSITDKWSLYGDFGLRNQQQETYEANGQFVRNNILLTLETSYTFSDNFSISGGVYEESFNMYDTKGRSWQPLHPENGATAYLQTTVTL